MDVLQPLSHSGGISIAGVLQKKGALGEHCRSNLRPLKHLRVTLSHMFFRVGGGSGGWAISGNGESGGGGGGGGVTVVPRGPSGPGNISV